MGRDIKNKETVRSVKTLDRVGTLRNMKHEVFHIKENTSKSHEDDSGSPTEYAQEHLADNTSRIAHETAYQTRSYGRKVLEKTKIKNKIEEFSAEGKRGQFLASNQTGEAGKSAVDEKRMVKGKDFTKRMAYKHKQRGEQTSRREYSLKKAESQLVRGRISTVEREGKRSADSFKRMQKPLMKGTIGNTSKVASKAVKTAERSAKAAIKTAHHSAIATKRAAKSTAIATRRSLQASRTAARTTFTAVKTAIKVTVQAIKTVIGTGKALAAAIAAGGWVAVLIIILMVLFGGILSMFGGGGTNGTSSVSAEVEAYDPLIRKYAVQHGIGEYAELIKAVMMQESGGRGNDPMQASECGYNTRYPNRPGGITDPEYSVDVGIQNLAACLNEAGAENPLDIENVKTALQGYNYGNGYISWAIARDGGYTAENAVEFSDTMASRYGWSAYGDKQYVPHVLQYYAFNNISLEGGSQAMVMVALTQLGNAGGYPYWSWYGFGSRVEWCACFVSWCANQCGYLEMGKLPKFAHVENEGVPWFKEKGQWKSRNYLPSPGDLIFFDWKNDGSPDHVGIVEKVDDGYVHTIEGNSGDACKQNSYPVGSNVIFGYGVY